MYKPIVATLGYVLSPNQKQVLLIHRNRRSDDDHLGKYNGLGGKMDPEESITTCMKREIREEAGIECGELELRGTINWTGFGPQGEDWLGFIFLIHSFTGEPMTHSDEGDLAWHPIENMMDLPMWEGDRHFLPLVFDGDPKVFHGYMPYRDGKPADWSFERI